MLLAMGVEWETHPETNEEREKGVKSDSHCMMRISSFAVISLLSSFLASALPCLAVLTVSISYFFSHDHTGGSQVSAVSSEVRVVTRLS